MGKKHNIDYIKNQIKIKHPKAILLTNEYKNSDTILNIICENGHN